MTTRATHRQGSAVPFAAMADRPILRKRADHHSQMLMPTRCVDLPPSPAPPVPTRLRNRVRDLASLALNRSGERLNALACIVHTVPRVHWRLWRLRYRDIDLGAVTVAASPATGLLGLAPTGMHAIALNLPVWGRGRLMLIGADGGPAAGHRKCRRDGIAAVSGGYGFPEVSASAIGMRWRMPR